MSEQEQTTQKTEAQVKQLIEKETQEPLRQVVDTVEPIVRNGIACDIIVGRTQKGIKDPREYATLNVDGLDYPSLLQFFGEEQVRSILTKHINIQCRGWSDEATVDNKIALASFRIFANELAVVRVSISDLREQFEAAQRELEKYVDPNNGYRARPGMEDKMYAAMGKQMEIKRKIDSLKRDKKAASEADELEPSALS